MRADSVFIAKNGTNLLFEAKSDPKGPEHLRRDGLDSEPISRAPTPDSFPPAAPVSKIGRAYAVPAEVTEEAYPEPVPEPVLEEEVQEVPHVTEDGDTWGLLASPPKKDRQKKKKGISRRVIEEAEPSVIYESERPVSNW